jgi:hypothetical protein
MRLLALFCVTALAAGCGKMAADDKAPKTTAHPQKDQPVSRMADDDSSHFKGKPVSAWVRQLRDRDVAARIEAAQVLKGLGPQAQAAVGDLKLAIKDRAWELLVEVCKNGNPTFTPVSSVIGRPHIPTKDEIIADLSRELEQKKKEIAAARKQIDDMGNDACLQALVLALDAIDRREMEAMILTGPPAKSKTFTKVGSTTSSTVRK